MVPLKHVGYIPTRRHRKISRIGGKAGMPEAFMPERFLKDGELDPAVRDPATIAFGFGRR